MATDDTNFYEEEYYDSDEGVEEVKPATLDLSDVDPDVFNIEVDADEDVKPNTVDVSGLDMSGFEIEDDGEEDDVLSSEEKLRLFSDQIIASCISGKDICRYAIDKLMSITNPRLFRDENYILFSIYYYYRSKLKNINIDAEFIKLFLNRNRDFISRSKGYIDINAYGEVDGSVEVGYLVGVVKHFNRLKNLPDISVSEFETYFEKYLIEFKAIEANKVYRQAQIILKEGLKIGKRLYSGFEDSQTYCKKQLAEIEGLVDQSQGTGFVKMSEVLLEEKPDNKKPIKIGDFGGLTHLNDAYGGIYTGLFYSFIAPPKSGKSKLSARLCYNVAIKAGNNVTVWAQEGGKDLWTAQMRAIHFDDVYNTGVDLVDKKFGVTQEVIIHDSFKTDELRQLELSSKLDLASNPAYGSIDYIDRPFNVETFIEDIDTSVKENNSQLVVVDYFQLIGSATNKPERERIAEAYKKMLAYCKQNNVAVISPAQFKQDAFDEMIKKSSVDSADLRTAAGGSSEVLRTPDVLFALWASVDDIRNNSMKIISLPSRLNAAFPTVNVYIDLATCQFISVD